MNRRAFLAGLGVVVATPFGARAQPIEGKAHRIAFISTTSPEASPTTDAFVQGLRELGYVEGKNLRVEWRWGRGTTERFPEFAAEVVRLNVDAIVAANSPAGYAAQRATQAIPIVIPTMADPVGDGFVASLARPGGNITGLTFNSPELQGKRLQLLKEALPNITQVALLIDTTDRNYRRLAEQADSAARVLGIRLHPVVEARRPSDLNDVFGTISKEHAGAALMVGGTVLYTNRVQVAKHALNARVAMMCDTTAHVEVGGLMSYGATLTDLFRRAAVYVDQILKGAKPGDLPVEQPTKFELVINLKTAKTLGLTIPPSLLLRADQVIE
jgi:putative tryptophan/tyrosine transport system substrate-binding protein